MEMEKANDVKSLLYGVRHDLGLINLGYADIQKLEEWIKDGHMEAEFFVEVGRDIERLEPHTLLYDDYIQITIETIKLIYKRIDEIETRVNEDLKKAIRILEGEDE